MPEPARPLNNAQMRGSFYFITVLIQKSMTNRISYNKPYKLAKDLVQLLQTRGLAISDFNRTENFL